MAITPYADLEELRRLGTVSDSKDAACDPFSSREPFPLDPASFQEAIEVADALIAGTPVGEEIIDFSKPILRPTEEEYQTIPLTRGKEAKVDAADFDVLNGFKWHCTDTGYAARRDADDKCVYMHRQILGLTDGKVHGDHINGDKLDNRRSNLRACSQRENNLNVPKRLGQGYTSRFKGVSWDPLTNKWRVTITKNGKQLVTIRVDDEIEAAEAYNDLAIKHHGRFAALNTIPCSDENCKGSFDEYGCCTECSNGHQDCEINECQVCLEKWIDRAENEADAAQDREMGL